MKVVIWIAIALCFLRGALPAFNHPQKDFSVSSAICMAGSIIAAAILCKPKNNETPAKNYNLLDE